MNTRVGMYSIHDSKSGYWNLPFFCSSHLEACHRLRQMLLDQNFSADKLGGLTLQYIGEFDYSSGRIMQLDCQGYHLETDGRSELVSILSDLLSDEEVE